MSARRKELELEDDRTAQKQYAKLLRDKPSRLSSYQGPRNSLWTRSGLPEPRKMTAGDLYGRVALVNPDDDLLAGGRDFYIGEGYADLNGINVFGWTTPIACTFFRGTDHHALCDDVAVVRAFRCESGQIVDFIDEALLQDAPAEPFTKRALSIPTPPSRPALLNRMQTDRERGPLLTQIEDSEAVPPAGLDDSLACRSTSDNAAGETTPMRAESLLRAQMLAPRARRLAPVLSTLQPDQYELVTIPAMESVIVEGQPGTGKTIVASHRAAYLVNEETPPENGLDGNVLIVGPTVGYSQHIRDVISRLAGPTERIKVLSLSELASLILGIKQPPHGHTSRTWQDGAWELVTFARSAIQQLKAANGVVPQLETVYEYLRQNGGILAKGRDKEWALYLRQLPSFKVALAGRIHPPLLAFIKWEIAKPAQLASVEHVIVDEAQDVTPLEWFLLDEINEADAWTILGDPNQRRSDHTLVSWEQILDVIAIDPDTPVRKMKRAYRSTKPILEFANRLLSRDQRKLQALQESGPEPVVQKVRANELADHVFRELNRLLSVYQTGTVAAISTTPAVITKVLRGRGWTSSFSDPQLWEKDGKAVTVAVPDEARGLEFDAVVVVEPADFPENFGRKGPLYTALTRANRELSVVHANPLPDELRRR